MGTFNNLWNEIKLYTINYQANHTLPPNIHIVVTSTSSISLCQCMIRLISNIEQLFILHVL